MEKGEGTEKEKETEEEWKQSKENLETRRENIWNGLFLLSIMTPLPWILHFTDKFPNSKHFILMA